MNDNHFPNPRIAIVIPAAVVLVVTSVAIALLAVSAILDQRKPPSPSTSPRRIALTDSLARHRALDSAALVQYGREVERARGDSLAWLLAAQARRIRTRWLPGRLDTLIQRDTVRDSVIVAGADVRAVLVADSACTVRADSLAGELVQARYDAQECSEELQKRPESCHGLSAFGIGVGVGAAATAGACLLVR